MATQEKILKNKNLRFPVPLTASGLEHYWKFSAGSGASVEDEISGSDATITGATWEEGLFNNAPNYSLFFNGSNQRITNAALDPTVTGDFTVIFWFKAPNQGAQNRMLELAQVAGLGLQICLNNTGQVVTDNVGGPTSGITSAAGFGDLCWHQAAISRSGTTYTLYVDSVSIGTSGGTAPTYTRMFAGERSDGEGDFTGFITSISIFDSALSGTAIADYYDLAPFLPSGNLMIESMYQCIETVVVPTNTTMVDFNTLLDGDLDGGYLVTLDIENPTASDSRYSLRINGVNQVVTRSYYEQTGAASLANAYETANAGAELQLDPTGDDGTAIIKIPFSKSGTGNWERFAFYETSKGTADANLSARRNALHMITTPANSVKIESLGIVGSIASSIGAGSVLKLWKLKNHA